MFDDYGYGLESGSLQSFGLLSAGVAIFALLMAHWDLVARVEALERSGVYA